MRYHLAAAALVACTIAAPTPVQPETRDIGDTLAKLITQAKTSIVIPGLDVGGLLEPERKYLCDNLKICPGGPQGIALPSTLPNVTKAKVPEDLATVASTVPSVVPTNAADVISKFTKSLGIGKRQDLNAIAEQAKARLSGLGGSSDVLKWAGGLFDACTVFDCVGAITKAIPAGSDKEEKGEKEENKEEEEGQEAGLRRRVDTTSLTSKFGLDSINWHSLTDKANLDGLTSKVNLPIQISGLTDPTLTANLGRFLISSCEQNQDCKNIADLVAQKTKDVDASKLPASVQSFASMLSKLVAKK